MRLRISPAIRDKLDHKKPPVDECEIVQCFANRDGAYLYDTRARHLTQPLTQWFIAETDKGRNLKVVFIHTDTGITIKSAFDPNATEIAIYKKYAYQRRNTP